MNCYCGKKVPFDACCLPIHKGKVAVTAEDLMRSRFSAFVTANIDYLKFSHHSETVHLVNFKELKKWTKSVKWVGLTVSQSVNGEAANLQGEVAFTALFVENGRMDSIQEHSIFYKEQGVWKYHSAK